MEIFLCGEEAVNACADTRPAALREVFFDERAAHSHLAATLAKLKALAREREKIPAPVAVPAETTERRAAQKTPSAAAPTHAVPAETTETRDANAPAETTDRAAPIASFSVKFVSDAELSRLAGTHKHGGVVARTERPAPAQLRPSMREEWFAAGERILFVFDVASPELLASIARVAVVCGVSRLIADEQATVPALMRSRTWSRSGGALEFLKLYRTESPAGALRMMSSRFFTVGFVREGGRRVDYASVPVFPGKNVAFVLGGAPNGIPAELTSRCGHLFHLSESEKTPIRFSAADVAALALPWIFAKTKRSGSGFFARKKAAEAARAAARGKQKS